MFTETKASPDFINIRDYFDAQWRQKYDIPMHDWIVNGANGSAVELRRMACFLTPDRVALVNGKLVFADTHLGQQAKQLMTGNFLQTLQAAKLQVAYQHAQQYRTWQELSDSEKRGFAKAIWKQRDAIGDNGVKQPFPAHIQETLCRMKQAPTPQELLAYLAEPVEIG